MRIKVYRLIASPGVAEATLEARVPLDEVADWLALGKKFVTLHTRPRKRLKSTRLPTPAYVETTSLAIAFKVLGATKLARRLGVEASEVRRWYRDGKDVPTEHLRQIAEIAEEVGS
jgi:hypothetical protein